MAETPKTIQIFLPDGEPRGLRIAEITTRLIQAVVIPVKRLDDAFKREEMSQSAVYFLFGEMDADTRPSVYIGETEDLIARLRHHRARKEFWNTAVVIVARNGFTRGHIKYLEWQCLERCEEVGRFTAENSVRPTQPFLPEPMQAETMDAFATMDILLSALGYPVFEPTRPRDRPEDTAIFVCEVKGVSATGSLTDDGFVVYAGSGAVLEDRGSSPTNISARRQRLQDDGILKPSGDALVFQRDMAFSSPSTAAAVVVGGAANGWKLWKDATGQRLTDVYRSDEDAGGGPDG